MSDPVEIVCRTLFDGARVHDGGRVVVHDGRITEVQTGVAASSMASDGVPVAPFVMPGLVDAHVHISGYREGMPAGRPFEPVKHFLRLCIANGVTCVRDTGNALETIAYAREWSDRYGGPRVFSAGPLLDVPPLTWPFSRIVRDAAAARREVAVLAQEGVDLIKAYRRIDAGTLTAIVAAAREHGLPVAVDSELTPVRHASAIGVRSLEHMANVLDEPDAPAPSNGHPGPAARALRWGHVDVRSDAVRSLGEELAERGTYVVPTLLVTRRWTFFDELVNDPHLELFAAVMPYHRHLVNLSNPVGQRIGRRFVKRYMPVTELSRSERALAERGTAAMGEVLAAYTELGVPVAAGTDTPNPSLAPGFSLHQELAEMVRRALTPLQALTAATASAGRLIGRDDIGVIRAGACADLLVLGGRADRDIAKLGSIEAVMKDGRWIDRDEALGKVVEAAEDL